MQTILSDSKGLYKNNHENIIMYKKYNNCQINTDVNTMGSKIWDNFKVFKV